MGAQHAFEAPFPLHRLLQRGGETVAESVEHPQHQRLSGGKMKEHGAVRDLGRPGEIGRVGIGESARGEEIQRGLDQSPLGRILLLFSRDSDHWMTINSLSVSSSYSTRTGPSTPKIESRRRFGGGAEMIY